MHFFDGGLLAAILSTMQQYTDGVRNLKVVEVNGSKIMVEGHRNGRTTQFIVSNEEQHEEMYSVFEVVAGHKQKIGFITPGLLRQESP